MAGSISVSRAMRVMQTGGLPRSITIEAGA